MLRQVVSRNLAVCMLNGHTDGQQATETLPVHSLLPLLSLATCFGMQRPVQCNRQVCRCANSKGDKGRRHKGQNGQRLESAKGKRHRGQRTQAPKAQKAHAQRRKGQKSQSPAGTKDKGQKGIGCKRHIPKKQKADRAKGTMGKSHKGSKPTSGAM